MTTLIFVVVVAALAYRATTPDTRRQALKTAAAFYIRWRDYGARELVPFEEALHARMSVILIAPAIAVVEIACFFLLNGATGISDGPRTTNGEWWRLLTAMCAHRSLLLLIVNAAAIVQLGRVLERLAGRFVFVAVFVVAGLFAELTTLWWHPLAPWVGASGAIYGLYGLLVVSFVAGRLRRSEVSIPVVALTRAAPLAAAFVLLNGLDHFAVASSDAVGFFAGAGIALATASGVSTQLPQARHVATALGAALIVAVGIAVPLRGIVDVAPEVGRLAELERQTRQSYETAYARYRKAETGVQAVVQVIDESILPALQSVDERLATLRHVPPEDAPRLAGARRYLQLRIDSWTLIAQTLGGETRTAATAGVADAAVDAGYRTRAQASHRAAAVARGKAEAAEREALEALHAVVDRADAR